MAGVTYSRESIQVQDIKNEQSQSANGCLARIRITAAERADSVSLVLPKTWESVQMTNVIRALCAESEKPVIIA